MDRRWDRMVKWNKDRGIATDPLSISICGIIPFNSQVAMEIFIARMVAICLPGIAYTGPDLNCRLFT
jgi:hypothetical protein